MTGNAYPTREQLNELENLTDPNQIVGALIELWNTDNGFLRYSRETRILELHTGGWSGNEDIIDVLGEMDFWDMYWRKIEHGGHYYFEIP